MVFSNLFKFQPLAEELHDILTQLMEDDNVEVWGSLVQLEDRTTLTWCLGSAAHVLHHTAAHYIVTFYILCFSHFAILLPLLTLLSSDTKTQTLYIVQTGVIC